MEKLLGKNSASRHYARLLALVGAIAAAGAWGGNACDAVYSSAAGSLSIPCVTLADDASAAVYRAEMRLVANSNPPTFILIKAENNQDAALPPDQIIIKFTPQVTQPDAPDFLALLSRDAGVAITYLRPMSGGAHVFNAAHSAQIPLATVLANLAKRSDVVYAEPDATMKPASAPPRTKP